MKPIFIFLLISIGLTLNWFHNGMLFGGAEAGIMFYDLQNQLNYASGAWSEQLVGNTTGLITTSAPMYAVLLVLQNVFNSKLFVQGLFFFLIIFISQFSVYIFIKTLFDKINDESATVAALFYLFNPLLIFLAWNRLLYTHIMMVAAMPMIFALFSVGIKKKNYFFSLLSSFAFLAFSYIYGAPAFLIGLWGYITLFCLLYFLIIDTKNKKFGVFYYVSTITSFILFNFWWIYFVFMTFIETASVAVEEGLVTSQGNLNSLLTISNRDGLLHGIFRFMPKGVVSISENWMSFYANPLYQLIISLIFLLILLSLFSKKYKKELKVILILFLLSIFAMKGVIGPFGEVFKFILQTVTPLQVFRNPFEKLGFFYVFFASVFFALGYQMYIKTKLLKFLVLVSILLIGFPLITKHAFKIGGTKDDTAFVSVPSDYIQADQALKDKDKRMLTVPFGGEGITYNWDHNYVGIEISNLLINKSNISLNTTVPYYTDIAKSLENNQLSEDIFIYTKLFNVDQILLRKDIDYYIRRMVEPSVSEKLLDSRLGKEFVEKNEYGDLSIYDIDESEQWPKIYRTSNIIYSNSVNPLKVIDKQNFDDHKIAILPLKSYDRDGALYIEADRYLQPQTDIKQAYYTNQELIDSLTHVSKLPDDPLYPLVLLKERIQRPQKENTLKYLRYIVSRMDKRIVELYRIRDDVGLSKKTLDNYNNLIHEIEKLHVNTGIKSLMFDFIVNESLLVHKELFARMNMPNDQLDKFLVDMEVVPKYKLPEAPDRTYIVAYISVPFDQGLSIEASDMLRESESVYVNGDEIKNPFDSEILFEKGEYEIAFRINPDLLETKIVTIENINVSNTDNFTLDFNSIDPVIVSFDYKFNNGDVFYFGIYQDVDGHRKVVADGDVTKRLFDSNWRHYSHDFSNPMKKSTSVIQIKNTKQVVCQKKLLIFKDCVLKDMPFNVDIRNLKISRLNDIHIALVKNTEKSLESKNVESYKINRSQYLAKFSKYDDIKEALVFSELYNNQWNVDDDRLIHMRANVYANAWLLGQPGEYNLEIYYKPEKYLSIGKIISITSVFIASIFVIFNYKKWLK